MAKPAHADQFSKILSFGDLNFGRVLQWISLIAPLDDVKVGTPHADTLAADSDGDVLAGFSGNDTLTSTFNRTALLGGDGRDTLSTDFTPVLAIGETFNGVAVQFGGDGNDTLHTRIAPTVVGPGSRTAIIGKVLLDGGTGNDTIDAAVRTAQAETLIYGGSGNDIINTVADTEATSFDNILASNTVNGGPGNDHIVADARTWLNALNASAQNVLSGGDGNDTLEATAVGRSNFTENVTNVLKGGRGDDVLRADNFANSNNAIPIATNDLQGGDGNDTLQAIITATFNRAPILTNSLDGGRGNDDLTASIDATRQFSDSGTRAVNNLDGGQGNDRLSAEIIAGDGAPFDTRAANHLDGGQGNDRLSADIIAGVGVFRSILDLSNVLDGESGNDILTASIQKQNPGDVDAHNRLDGGSGNDTLVASIYGTAGSSTLAGGSGNDRLTVAGGTDNVLDGGRGRDHLFAGSGDDAMTGGSGVDTFHFDVLRQQGSDTITDFQKKGDILAFAGVTDQGAPGLVDDLDTLSTFTDAGPGGDVTVKLSVGTTITFAGLGTGTVDSWADLVSHPAKQLVGDQGPAGFMRNPEKGHLYRFVDDALTFPEALKAAAHAGGYLATVTSVQENQFLLDLFQSTPHGSNTNGGWLGGSDAAREGIWNWITGPEAGQTFWRSGSDPQPGYSNWGAGEPNNVAGAEHYLDFVSTGFWNDNDAANAGRNTGYFIEIG